MSFEYKEDKKYFVDLIAGGDELLFNEKFTHLFDFRDSKIKRDEFNRLIKQLKPQILKRDKICRLKLNDGCLIDERFEIDHVIPLLTNKLNKELRNMKPEPNCKVVSQSFGLNHIDNLVLACHNCNGFKKHKLLRKEDIMRIINTVANS